MQYTTAGFSVFGLWNVLTVGTERVARSLLEGLGAKGRKAWRVET
jgi:hypothetical protein